MYIIDNVHVLIHVDQTEPRSQGACWIALPLDTNSAGNEVAAYFIKKQKTINNIFDNRQQARRLSQYASLRPAPHMIKNKNLFF